MMRVTTHWKPRYSPARASLKSTFGHELHLRTPPVDANSFKLRELASWYREFAERAGNPVVWEARLRTAQDLETEADHIDRSIRSETPARRFVSW